MRNVFVNGIYLLVVVVVTLVISTLSITRKVNSFHENNRFLDFIVDKEDIVITNAIPGRVNEILVKPGDRVRSGDVLVEIVDEGLLAKLEGLSASEDFNTSAKTEADLIRSQLDQFKIRAPRDGVIYDINNVVGANLSINTPVMTMYADNGVRLKTNMTQEQLDQIQRVNTLDVLSPRFEQVYQVEYLSVGKATYDRTTAVNTYEVYFSFTDKSVGAVFLEGEVLEVIGSRRKGVKRPADYFVDAWNSMIIGDGLVN